MPDITVIILTYNEELHIRRCIENVNLFAKEVMLVDSFSNDRTIEIATSLGAKVFQNKWENNHARQFNWGLQNLPISTGWILRLDADEYLLPELIQELYEKIDNQPENITGIVFNRRHIFLDKWMKRGTYPVKLLRLFRNKKAICEQRWMDEHIQLLEGDSVEFKHDMVDHNLNNLDHFIAKHTGYAVREAIDLLDLEYNISGSFDDMNLTGQAAAKRRKKHKYARQPIIWRSFAYYLYRYLLRFGFLEGKKGFLWHFLQGWWYRTLVDANILEIKRACGADKEKIRTYIFKNYSIQL
jgi:glycosyltransferase involved in cell wall biosynthesis